MSYSEAGRLGGLEIDKRKTREQNIQAWNEDPKRCLECNKPLSYEQKYNKFCSISCAATHNNRGVTRNKLKDRGECTNCGKKLVRGQRKYCSNKCQYAYQWKLRKQEIETKQFIPDKSRHVARRYLIEKYGHRCQICENEEWMNKPIPLVMDHIDGNHLNGNLSNLRVICPNCDAQLPTYKGANRGNGRTYRRKEKE